MLVASLEIVFHDKEVCCGKDSALEDSVQSSNPKSLKDIANKLQGRHLLGDGRPIMVTVEYLKPEQVNGGHLIYMLTKKHAPLMMWNAHLYIVDGITYVGDVDATTGGIMICSNDSIRSLARRAPPSHPNPSGPGCPIFPG